MVGSIDTPQMGERALSWRRPAVRNIRWRLFKSDWFVAEIIVATAPAAILLGSGRASLAGYYFWGIFALLLGRNLLTGRRDEVLCLILAAGPFINLLRQFAFYNVIIGLFLVGFAYYFASRPQAVWGVFRTYPLLTMIFVLVGVFYVLSFYNTRDYAANLRFFELVLTVGFILLLGRQRALLGAALLGMVVSACLVGASMLPYVHSSSAARLGMIEVEGRVLGNPGQLGVPLAFGFLGAMVDGGQWLGLQGRLWRRLLLLAPTLPLLALTTSRASWLVAAMGILTSMLLGSRQRMRMLLAIVLVFVAAQFVLLSPYGGMLKRGLERTFSDERSLRQRTSGRSDLFQVAYFAFTKSFASVVHGYGPGCGPMVYAQASHEVEGIRYAVGKKVAFHSLFMQVAVEAGLLGIGVLLFWLCLALLRIWRWVVQNKLVLPLVCFIGYLLIVVTVSGIDINSGIFLGLALLATGSFQTSIR